MLFKTIVLLNIFAVSRVKTLTDCDIPLSSLYGEKSPILLKNHTKAFEFVTPNGRNIAIETNKQIYLLCSGEKNYLTKSNTNLTALTCKEGLLKIGNTTVRPNELQCKNLAFGRVKATRNACANGKGIIEEIGYEIEKNKAISLIKLCYDKKTLTTYYAQHLLCNNVTEYASKPTRSKLTIYKDLTESNSTSVAYQHSFQKSTFNTVLGSNLADKYITSETYLVRGYLAPDQDFIFAPFQYASHIYINSNPLWQTVYRGNWDRLESLVRSHASNYRQKMLVYTGSYGIFKLPKADNKTTSIYLLPNNTLPVPKYFWKILYDWTSRNSIVFVIVNDPFIKQINNKDIFCPNVCAKYGWHLDAWLETAEGFLFCCEYKRFNDVVLTSPKLNVNNAMKRAEKII